MTTTDARPCPLRQLAKDSLPAECQHRKPPTVAAGCAADLAPGLRHRSRSGNLDPKRPKQQLKSEPQSGHLTPALTGGPHDARPVRMQRIVRRRDTVRSAVSRPILYESTHSGQGNGRRPATTFSRSGRIGCAGRSQAPSGLQTPCRPAPATDTTKRERKPGTPRSSAERRHAASGCRSASTSPDRSIREPPAGLVE